MVGKEKVAARKRQAPRFELAANLKALLELMDITGPVLAARAGVDRKTINNMLNARFDPRYENADKVARVFGLTGWQLLQPIEPSRIKILPKASDIEALIERFYEATPEQRETILGVAQMIRERR